MPKRDTDAGELLVRALDQVVGGIALARYAATQTTDSALQGMFRRLVATGETQEKLLRRHLSGYPGPLDSGGRGIRAIQVVGSAAAMAVGFGLATAAYRAYKAG